MKRGTRRYLLNTKDYDYKKRKITFTTIIKGLWGCLSYIIFYQTDPRLAGSRRRHNSQRGNPLRSPLRKVWTPPGMHNMMQVLLVIHTLDILCPFAGGRNFTAVLTCGWNRCCRCRRFCDTRISSVKEALLGVNSDKRHGLDPAT